MKNFTLTREYLGYQSKKDITNTDNNYLAQGSQNVLINDGEKVVASPGYSLYGPAGTTYTGVLASFDWDLPGGGERRIRHYKDALEYNYVDALGAVTWRSLMPISGEKKYRFTTWWSQSENQEYLLFVDGSSNIYMWSGAIATIASNTATTLTKQGTETWAELGFLNSVAREVVINGVAYSYTGGEGTTTLTGLTGLPTFSVGDIAHQAVITTANTPSSSNKNDVIGVHKNQVYIGSHSTRTVYVSKNNSYVDFTFSVHRVPGDGALLTLDGPTVGFVPQEDAMYITAGKDLWYQTTFTISSDNTREVLDIKRLKSGPQQAAQSQELIGNIKNSVVFVSNEPTFDTLGRIENIDSPQARPLSEPIKLEFQSFNFNNGHILYFKNSTYIALPGEGKVLIYDHANGYWQPPQTISISRLSIINGELYGHSSTNNETYKLFDTSTYTHNGNPIESIAAFPYNNFGSRTQQKRYDEYFLEGYASLETKIDVVYKYDFGGYTQIIQKQIDMADTDITLYTTSDGSLGKMPLGTFPLGSVTDSVDDLPKYRTIHTINKPGFYEMQIIFRTNTENYRWQMLAHGPNVMLSTADNIAIKK